jgi:hypothetical protein
MNVLIATLSSVGATPPIQLDYNKITSDSVQTVVVTSGAGGLNYNVEYSLDQPSTTPSLMTWFSSGSSNLSTNAFISLPTPIRSLRISITAATSNMSLSGTVIESFL